MGKKRDPGGLLTTGIHRPPQQEATPRGTERAVFCALAERNDLLTPVYTWAFLNTLERRQRVEAV